MKIQRLQLTQFKNFTQKKIHFEEDLVGITGANGKGKTSILDAVHYLSLTKSYINALDKYNIQFDKDFFTLKGDFLKEDEEYHIQVVVQEGKKKEIKKNQKPYARLSDHIGLIKTIIISPYDRDLIWEGSDVRRKFLDHLISQIDATYLTQLMRYNKTLNQRNTVLKFFREQGTFDADVLASYNQEMRTSGSYIYQKRKDLMDEIRPIFQEMYREISQSDESVSMVYQSDLDEEDWATLFAQSATQDLQSGYTQKGIHKDDIILQLAQFPVKRVASQGQQKTFVIAMRMAQTQLLIKRTKQNPIVLLDDIFDKLDEHRVQHLVGLIQRKQFGQVLITDTDAGRMKSIFAGIDHASQTITL